jgi:hypothetical protein
VIVLQFRQRIAGAFAEYVPMKPVGTITSSPTGLSRLDTDSRDQYKPEPLVVETKPCSTGPPHLAQVTSAILGGESGIRTE